MIRLRNTLGALALVCVTLSCSDELGEGTNSQGNALAGQKGYVKIAINLPTSSGVGTKADDGLENDQYDDGAENEYKVNSVDLLIFAGSSESNATVFQLIPLTDMVNQFSGVGLDDDEITTSAQATVEVDIPESGNIYGLAIVNGSVSLSGSTATINGNSVSNFSDLFDKRSNVILSSFIGTEKDNFFMLNAPILASDANTTISSTDVSADDVTTLVQLTAYPEEDVVNAPPADIYVERLVAKVTVGSGSFMEDQSSSDGELAGKYYMPVLTSGIYYGDRAYLMNWYLNVTNKSTKLGHDVYGGNYSSSPAFVEWAAYENSTGIVGSRFFSANTYKPRRVYWAIDGNYDGHGTDEFNIVQGEISSDISPSVDNLFDNPVYCFENTMNYNQMSQEQTTGIVFEMKYLFDTAREAKTFWVVGDDIENPVYTDDLAEKVNSLLFGDNLSVKVKGDVEDLKGGYYSNIAEMQRIFETSSGESLNGDQAAIVSARIGMLRMYKNGTTYYYAANIKHFGDYYCDIEPVESVNDYEESHLGRYGVVRNNWYEIVVQDISGPGMPEKPNPEEPDPTPDPDPDPDPDYPDPDDPKKPTFIRCRVNILPWTVRKQAVHL